MTAVFAGAVVVACGGGGGGSTSGDSGDKLFVSVGYGSTPIDLFAQTTVPPLLTGFDGHAPLCSVTTGSVPPGMTLGRDCTIAGRPTQAGAFTFTLSVGAVGGANTVPIVATVKVAGPKVYYTGHDAFLSGLNVGQAVSDDPAVSDWRAPADVSQRWSYSVASGSLPPGLSLDATTGKISGVTLTAGAYSATIAATLDTVYGSWQSLAAHYGANVSVAAFGFLNLSGTGTNAQSVPIAYISQPAHFSAWSSGGSVSGVDLHGATLPAGLALDAGTNAIDGTVRDQATGVQTLSGLTATVTDNGVASSATGTWSVDIEYPVFVRYPWGQGPAGSPLAITPTLDLSPIALVAPSYSYAVRPSECTLPPGMSLDASSGTLSGTPSVAGSYSCAVDATITNNGVTWTQRAFASFLVQ